MYPGFFRMMNYFEFYNIPVSIDPDLKVIRQRYVELSRKYHPDFYTHKDNAQQAMALEMSTVNTSAYSTLMDFDSRLLHLMDIKGIDVTKQKKLPQEFLMSMMEINESLVDAKISGDQNKLTQIEENLKELISQCLNNISKFIAEYDKGETKEIASLLLDILSEINKKNYIIKLQNQLLE